MFKYRVLTFTIILSMLLFYATPIGSVDVKAEEVTYTQRQLQDVGAWFIGERLLEGAVENFNFDNLPTDISVDDFLADLGAIIAEGNPDPLLDDLGQAADDIWNGIEQELSNWTADDAWSLVKDTFYTLWYDVDPPTSFPLADVLIMADGINEQLGVYDRLLQYANTDIFEYPPEYDLLIEQTNGLSNGYGFFWSNYPNEYYYSQYDAYHAKSYPYINHSWFRPSLSANSLNNFPTTAFTSGACVGSTNLLTLTINTISENIVNGNISGISVEYPQAYVTDSFGFTKQIEFNNNSVFYGNNTDFNISSSYSYQDTSIYNVLSHFSHKFRNINIIVDGNNWAVVNPDNPIASTDLTYPNYQPAKYNYPEGTSVDWNRLYSIIYNAVRDGIVLDFGDLEDCFVDVNGQTAIATLGLVRNDYDNLVQEQFTMVPYPRFNNNLWLTNLAEEMTGPAQYGVIIIENAYNIFPLPLQKALLFAGALLLFGLLIRRFLE